MSVKTQNAEQLTIGENGKLRTNQNPFLDALTVKDVALAETEFKKYCGLLDKISCTSTMHKNTAARRKSRFSRRLRDLKQG